ncbi:MAG: class A beta-lactamase-related serine hydrolase [Gemmatimonadota bacterium]|nr:class A beta-lactamase-related serine hydrolase [Gemmatimonadota bacterium]
MTLLAVPILSSCGPNPETLEELRTAVEQRIVESDAETVGFYFRSLRTGDTLFFDVDSRMHAASMMKVPVMIQLYRDHEAGRINLDDSIPITNTFRSVVDGSTYELSATDDSDSTLYNRIGQSESIRLLMERMITVSSNLATNILIDLVDAERVQASMEDLGADSINVVRGVEDTKAYDAGLSNTTTARAMGAVFEAIVGGRAASQPACHEMVEVLSRQQLNEGIPAGVPRRIRVAHKTGSITEIQHDGGIVYERDDPVYLLVIMVQGIADEEAAHELIANLSRTVWRFASREPDSPVEE